MKPPINNDINKLFEKAKAEEQNLDDFEKDALAGFNMLESEQEANELKSALDTRINKELFTKTEKNNSKVYWLAAAGLFLVIGLSTFFILNNTDTVLKSSDLAIVTEIPKKEASLNEIKQEESTDKTVPPVEKQNPQPTDVANKLAPDAKTRLLQSQNRKEPEKGIFLERDAKDVPNSNLDRVERFAEKKENDLADGQNYLNVSRPKSNTSQENNLAQGAVSKINKDDNITVGGYISEDKESDAFKAKITTAAPVQNQKIEETIVTTQDEIAFESVEQNRKKEKNGEIEGSKGDGNKYRQSDQTIVTKNTSTSLAKEKNKNEKKSGSTSTTPFSMAGNTTGPVNAEYKSGADSKTTETAKSSETSAGERRSDNGVAVNLREENTINCYYADGKTSINKDLEEKLMTKNLNHKFEATLYITEKKTVDKVEFTNSYDLTKTQKEEIIKILKSLNKFNFYTTPTKKETFPYKIFYKPSSSPYLLDKTK